MRKLVLIAVAALAVPATSLAQFQLGARVGYAPAMGDAAKDFKMKDFGVKSQIPIQIDASYRATPDLAVGVYGSYGIGQTDSSGFYGACGVSGVSCSGSTLRFGVQGLYAFNQVQSVLVPWLGLGLGWEQAKSKISGGGVTGEFTLDGYELALQAGGDYKVSDQFSVGPYVMFSIGQYRNAKVTNNYNPAYNVSGSIDEKANHQWFGFGLAGKFNL
jgi:outer membrane autotransporter protein